MIQVSAPPATATASARPRLPSDPVAADGQAGEFDAVLADTPAKDAAPADESPACAEKEMVQSPMPGDDIDGLPFADADPDDALHLAPEPGPLEVGPDALPVLSDPEVSREPSDSDDPQDPDCEMPAQDPVSATGVSPQMLASSPPATDISDTPSATDGSRISTVRIALREQPATGSAEIDGTSDKVTAPPAALRERSANAGHSVEASPLLPRPDIEATGLGGPDNLPLMAGTLAQTGEAAGPTFGAALSGLSASGGTEPVAGGRPAFGMGQTGLILTPAPATLGPAIARIVQAGPDDAVEIQLAPHELGRLRIRVSSDSDTAHVILQAERPETLDLLRRNGDVLMKELRAAGYSGGTLDFAGWSDGNSRSAFAFAQGPVPVGEEVPFAEPRVMPSPAPGRSERGLNLRL